MNLIDIEDFTCKCPTHTKKKGKKVKLKRRLDSKLIDGVMRAKEGWGSLVQTWCTRCNVIHFTDFIPDSKAMN